MRLAPELTSVCALTNLPKYSYGWVPAKYRQETTMKDQKPDRFGRITRTTSLIPVIRRIGFVGTMPIPPNVDEKWIAAYLRQFHGEGTYTVDLMNRQPGSSEYMCINTWSGIRIAVEDLKGNDYGKPINPQKRHIMLPKAEKVALNPEPEPEPKPKKPRKKSKPKSKPKTEEVDVFAAAIKGGLFKKDIEEP